MKAIIGTFDEREQVETAVSRLQEVGLAEADIALITACEAEEVRDVLDNEPEQTAATGALVGSGIGGVLGLLGSAVVLPIPGAGPVLASGIMATASSGVLGGYLGAIYATRAASQPEHELKEALANDRVLLIARVNDTNEEEVRVILRQAGGNYLETHEVTPEMMAEAAG